MGLLNTCSEENRVVDQGDTYTFTTEPALTYNIGTREEDKAYYREVVMQWRGTVHLSKSYRYVCLDQDTAVAAAIAITNAYTKNVERWGIGLQETEGGSNVFRYEYIVLGAIPVCGCTATPVHVAGPVWEVEVAVDISADKYTTYDAQGTNAPTVSQLKAAVAAFTNFPEIVGAGGTVNLSSSNN